MDTEGQSSGTTREMEQNLSSIKIREHLVAMTSNDRPVNIGFTWPTSCSFKVTPG
jgi:hypothetical protein